MKVLIDDIAKFLTEGWPTPKGDWFFDHEDAHPIETQLKWDGDNDVYVPVTPGEKVELADFDAEIMYQGSNRPEPATKMLAKEFKAWMRRRTHQTLVVEIPTEKVEEFTKIVRQMGAKVV
jgi:hypothetical protein